MCCGNPLESRLNDLAKDQMHCLSVCQLWLEFAQPRRGVMFIDMTFSPNPKPCMGDMFIY